MKDASAEEQDVSEMRRLVEGHDAALNCLMERHGTRLFHYLMRHLQSEVEAADLAQEAFVRVYQHRERFNPRHKFSTWLYTIATNLARDRLKWRARHPQVSLHETTGESETALVDVLADASPGPDDQLISNQRAQAVREAIAALPEELRIPLLLSEYEELANADAAQVLGCSVKAFESRLYRAKVRLREVIGNKLQSA